ncbi:alpha/beta hydrolase family esterase [Haliea sp. E17]|uniref:alpha/beta hydrolase family esterase n=1 Tax=Haliea sp. E17 TaxID=3401576 RepID=UPI003AAA3D15
MAVHTPHRKSGYALYSQVAVLVLSLGACGSNNDNNNGDNNPEPVPEPGLVSCADTASCASNPPLEIGGERPAQVEIPSNYDLNTRYPLVIVLHGYGVTGSIESLYLGLDSRVDDKQVVLVKPDGTPNLAGTRFWNATPACCAKVAAAEDNSGEDYTQIDDVAYLRGLIEEAAATYSIDTGRITLFGHSNGGFLALRMVCEAADYVTAVISLAGSTFADAASCAPASLPVSVLLLHGTLDETIAYAGDEILGEAFPGAQETAMRFAGLGGCDDSNPAQLGTADVVNSLPGEETSIIGYTDCQPGIDVELWTIVDGPHIPLPWVPAAIDNFVDWLLDHPRPN